MSDSIRAFLFARDGKNFVARIYVDDIADAPWERAEGHGPVRTVRARGVQSANKRPGERVLHSNGHTVWLYDWKAACETAKHDGWNAAPHDARNRVGRAVAEDFDFLRGWLRGDWQYVGVVTCAGDGSFSQDDTDFYSNACWGIESTAEEYLREVAAEQAAQI